MSETLKTEQDVVDHVGRLGQATLTRMPALDAAQARALTDRIKVGVEAVWELIAQAFTERVWDALGYKSWDDYCTREFGSSRLRLPREERTEVVASLRESGLSIRAIASATGIDRNTVRSDLRNDVGELHPPDPEADEDALAEELIANELAPVIGLDGKRYKKPTPPAPQPVRRSPITDQARTAGWELRKSVERIQRLAADDRFASQIEKVTPHLRGHLTNAIEVCQDVLNRINTQE